ncbi:hypothetical protein [Blastococcus brunescens]|uniref:S-adenosylmethionine-dependent methyltransferase Rv2258c-like winged HTH domain-containing protein n=1 Tax=Blastococcus brunescens TaxID=1564165 RepID=A0ABZ1AZB9_9ACTN|nr:hypothetical protein [Blastococcus sp. BMG 8361]WRL63915.1 hypothetical protein U6N30_30645 [Blastococcus sp. BMG 8361]
MQPSPGGDLGERLLAAVIGAFEAAAVDLGVRLGWYRALADATASAPELADRTGTDARYAREWLEQQAVAGYLAVEDVTSAPDERRYSFPRSTDGCWSTSSTRRSPPHWPTRRWRSPGTSHGWRRCTAAGQG